MSSDRIVVQLTITIDCDGKPTVVVAPPGPGTGVVGGGDPPVGGSSTVPGTGTATPPAPAATVAAQRTVHIVAGNGGLAWFTLLWPVPEVALSANPQHALDDRTRFGPVPGTGAEHPLHVRRVGPRLLWDGTGSHAQPTVFVAGVNQTHTSAPQMTTITGGPEIVAAGAKAQLPLAAPLPVLAIGQGLPYGPAPGAPAAVAVSTIDAAIAALGAVTTITPATEQDLRPSAAQLATMVDSATPAKVAELARNLLFAANAFRLGLVSTVLMPAFNDDPHGAFAGGDALAAARADAVARVLDGFYAELARHPEPKASATGTPMKLSDNVLTLITGDTPKNSFNRNGWPDGTPGGANIVFVRANGYLKPGWFGALTGNGRVNFDPATGAQSASASTPASTIAAQLAVLFAIARGDAAAVAAASAAPFAGIVASPLP